MIPAQKPQSDYAIGAERDTDLLDVLQTKKIMPLSALRPYLWRDECGDLVMIAQWGEMFLCDENTLCLSLFPQSYGSNCVESA